ncbi:MAG: NUDIX domain-containing protein [Thiotrichales bacterium]|nr:NUDIX domain-containing protein [Thiotrichales bacterium]
MIKSIKISNVETGYNGFFRIDILKYQHTLYEGGWSETVSRELFGRGQAVVVLMYDLSKELVILIEQCRAGALRHAQEAGKSEQAWLLEPVAGMIDFEETPEQAGIREAQEEAGIALDSLEYICQYYPSPGGCDEVLHVYASAIDATLLPEFSGLAEEHEDIKIVKVPFSDAKARLRSGQFNVSSTIIALQWLFYQKLAK